MKEDIKDPSERTADHEERQPRNEGDINKRLRRPIIGFPNGNNAVYNAISFYETHYSTDFVPQIVDCQKKEKMIINRKAAMVAFALSTAMLVSGCASKQAKVASETKHIPFMPLSDTLIAQYKGDLKGLYRAWIKPREDDSFGITMKSDAQKLSVQKDIGDGLSRFCRASNGTFNTLPFDTGTHYYCERPDGSQIGQVTVKRLSTGSESFIGITLDRDEQVAKAEKRFQDRMKVNGPTGWINTTWGKFRLLRIGDLDSRELFNVAHRAKPNFGGVEFEDIHRIQFDERCCDMTVTLADGRSERLNSAEIVLRKPDSDYVGLPTTFVVLDPESGQPFAWKPPQDVVRSIEFDRDKTLANSSNTPIKTSYQPVTDAKLKRYRENLKKEAQALTKKAQSEGWWKLVFPEGRLVHGLNDNLKKNLWWWSRFNNPDCIGNVRKGIVDPDTLLRCSVAASEYDSVVVTGYPLTVDHTPLSMHFVLNSSKGLGKK